MSWFARVFASAVVRRLAYVLVGALLLYLGVGRADAANRGEAAQQCQLAIPPLCNAGTNQTDCECRHEVINPPIVTPEGTLVGQYILSAVSNISGNRGDYSYYSHIGCPAGSEWNETSQTCFNSEECLAHNSEPGFLNAGSVTKPFSETCAGGCQYKLQAGSGGCTVLGGVGGGAKLCVGEFEFTGSACGLPPVPAPPAPLPNKEQECIPAAGGQTFCTKPNGDQCYSASSGRQICWNPGETGEKSDGNILQVRNAGEEPLPPNTPAPPGDSYGPPGPPIPTTQIINGTTIITVVVNTPTTGGTTPPAPPGGEPNDGSGGSGGGDGDDEEDGPENEASGGVNCAVPDLVCAPGTNSVECQTLINVWYLRCKGVDLTGGDTCASAPTCHGNAGDCYMSKQMWNMRCNEGTGSESSVLAKLVSDQAAVFGDGNDNDGPGTSVIDSIFPGGKGLAGDPDEARYISDHTGSTGSLFGTVDRFLGGSATCPIQPEIAVNGGFSISLVITPICELLIQLGEVLVALSYFAGIRMYLGGRA